MAERLRRLMKGWFDPDDREKDVKLFAFMAVVVAGIVWLSIKMYGPLTDQWVNAFYGLCALVGLGGTALGLVENARKKDPQ